MGYLNDFDKAELKSFAPLEAERFLMGSLSFSARGGSALGGDF